MIRLQQTELLPKLFGQVYLTDVVQKELANWPGKDFSDIREFAKNPPEWVIQKSPTAIAPEVAKANECKVKLDPGEASAISLALELSKDGSRGIVLSDDGKARAFLNQEQNPEKSKEMAANSMSTFGTHGPTHPASENQRIFATNTFSILCQGRERGFVSDLNQAVDKAKEIGVTPSRKVENKLSQFSRHLQDIEKRQQHEHDIDR